MAARISNRNIEEVIAANDIVSVVEKYVQLSKKSSSNFFGLCPFHSEDTPSFSVAPAKQIFYCFGCHKGGNVITFIQEIEHVSFPEALRILAERSNIKLDEGDDPATIRAEQRRKRMEALMVEAARFYYHQLQTPAAESARAYLSKKRGLSEKTLIAFGIGYAPKDKSSLCRHLKAKGYTESEIASSGLVRRSPQGYLSDFLYGRVVFPIFDTYGRLIAYGGRAMDDENPKYMNSPETELYHKGSILYGFNFARKEIKDEVILTEGYMDTISLHEAGFKQTVASLGTAFTKSQAQLIKRFCNRVVLCYDADSAGQKATERAIPLLQEAGLEVRVLLIPEGKDPDDFIRHYGADRFGLLLKDAICVTEYRLHCAKEQSLDASGNLLPLQYQDLAVQVLMREKNEIIREIYAVRVANELKTVSAETVKREVIQRLKGKAETAQKTVEISLPPPTNNEMKLFSVTEARFLSNLLVEPDLFEELQGQIPTVSSFQNPKVWPLIQRFYDNLNEKSDFETAKILEIVEEDEFRELAGEFKKSILPLILSSETSTYADAKAITERTIKLIQMEGLERRKNRILSEITEAKDNTLKQNLLAELQSISKEYNELRTKQ